MDKADGVKRVKRKRVSKKTKKAWRKHSDIKDVEAFLEDQRLQERTGGLVAEKTNAELFVVDRGPDPSVDAAANLTQNRRLPKPLRCHAALLPDPRIPPARISRSSTRKEKDAKIKKETQRSTPTADVGLAKQSNTTQKRKQPITTFDLWASDDIIAPPAGVDEHYLAVCKMKRIRPPSYYHDKPSDLPAIEAPHPGTSYRPTAEDHKALLHKAAEVEMKRLREEQRIKRALDDKFPTIKDAPDENTWLNEWAAGENEHDDDNGAGDDPSASEVSHNPPVRREDKKSERERKRLKALKEKEKEAMKEKELKIRSSRIFRLKTAKKEVLKRELALAARGARRELEKERTSRVMTRRLGRVKYEEPNIDLKLTEEQVGSLRLLKPEGSLLKDHLTSLQKRNIVEPRQRAKVVYKYKPKVFEKKSHREIME